MKVTKLIQNFMKQFPLTLTIEDPSPLFRKNNQYLNCVFFRKSYFYRRWNFAINEDILMNVILYSVITKHELQMFNSSWKSSIFGHN